MLLYIEHILNGVRWGTEFPERLYNIVESCYYVGDYPPVLLECIALQFEQCYGLLNWDYKDQSEDELIVKVTTLIGILDSRYKDEFDYDTRSYDTRATSYFEEGNQAFDFFTLKSFCVLMKFFELHEKLQLAHKVESFCLVSK